MISRREFLLGLSSAIPVATWTNIPPAIAETSETPSEFLSVSRILTGNDALSADVADRIEALLVDRETDFTMKFGTLAEKIHSGGSSREEKLSGLSEDEVSFVLEIAKPWYLGYVGDPSNNILEDDAAFATFLEAQSYEKIIREVPRPTYPDRDPGWFSAVPDGVTAPDMPKDVTSWSFEPVGPGKIRDPSPEWLAYAKAKHTDLEAARKAKP